MQALVSIIIPVYNLENYIENCLNSIIAQTYRNLEIICVDDGSCDRSGEIIKSMAENDSRIFYIRQENAGVSAARNNGLDNAHGDYIMFADGDDYMHFQAVEIFVNSITEDNYDFVYGASQTTYSLNESQKNIIETHAVESSVEELFSLQINKSFGRYIWCKIFKKTMLENKAFNEVFSFGEDTIFMFSIFTERQYKIGFVNEVLYFYFQRENSACRDNQYRGIKEIELYEKILQIAQSSQHEFLSAYALKNLLGNTLSIRSKYFDSRNIIDKKLKTIWKNYSKTFIMSKYFNFKLKLFYIISVYSKTLYEVFRRIKDPKFK